MNNQKILLVGCGKMGSALLKGMTNAGILPRNIIVIEPNSSNVHDNFNVKVLKSFDHSEIEGFNPDLVIFAVKPQIIESILHNYKHFSKDTLFISIIAGKTVAFFEKHLGKNAAIIRTMPNLPVIIGKGMIVWYKNNNVSEKQLEVLNHFFFNTGEHIQIADESMLDAVTAISGSGPAYVFHFIECLTQAGIELGLPNEMAGNLAINTVLGSASLAFGSNESPTKLREMVTSPSGTTEAALKILMQNNNMQKLLVDATTAACKRSQDLSE